MGSIQRLFEAYGRVGLRVVAVSIDNGGSRSSVADFVAQHGLTFEILLDPDARIMESFHLVGVPGSFLIDRDGTVRGVYLGERKWDSDSARRVVERLLTGDPGGAAKR
jgi:peroxiredoxin